MKRILTILFLLSTAGMFAATPSQPISGLLHRILPHNGDADRLSWQLTPGNQQQFTVACDGHKVNVSGTDYVAIATGINWYLQHYAGIDISWDSPTATLPASLPVCEAQTHSASVQWRYYLNFCTYSYSMAFWDWQRWQQELDWMALHGVNMPLAVTEMECVWKEVLQNTYGLTPQAVATFLPGSSYYGWFFMNNITGWGGPQPEPWYEHQKALARQIFRRMTEFGMSPVIPGYVGMIPADFLSQARADKVTAWRQTDIVDGGTWCSFRRPAFVNNTQRLREFAAQYYAAFRRLFGDVCHTHFYAIDPFHEGGVPRGVTDAKASVAAMWEALTAYDADAVWVAQHWQDNPTPILTHTIPQGRLIILDLHGDQNADTQCSGHHTTAQGEPHQWVWGQVSNFGGNVGLFGRMDRLIHCFYAARDAQQENKLVGIGALPEGIHNNPMLYDLLYALPWTIDDYTRDTWLRDYIYIRYGVRQGSRPYKALLAAWTHLAGIYNCPSDTQQGTTESVLLMRPSLTPGTVSSWAASSWYWDMADVRTALAEMLSVSDTMQGNGRYRYDLVELTRQCLADYGKSLLDSLRTTLPAAVTTPASPPELPPLAARFLQLILDQDRLLGTRAEFRLGSWTEAARAFGKSTTEKNLYERNARMLLTTWGARQQSEDGGLHDYANREWQGLLSSFYYPRWKAFFRNGCTPQPWFEQFEWPFVQGESPAYGTFTAQPEGDEIAIAKELFHKYLR